MNYLHLYTQTINQIKYLRMCHIATQTSQKSCHYVKIWKMLHQLTRLCKIVVIPRNFNYSWDIMVWVLLISSRPNALQQIVKILISNWKLLEKSIILKQFKTKMLQSRLLQDFAVLEHIKVPLIKLIHQFYEICPHSCIQINNLTKSLFFFLDLVCIRLFSLSM
jgi:hypothetical protein